MLLYYGNLTTEGTSLKCRTPSTFLHYNGGWSSSFLAFQNLDAVFDKAEGYGFVFSPVRLLKTSWLTILFANALENTAVGCFLLCS